MKFEFIIIMVTGFLIFNTYHDGRYLKILKSWKKYYQMGFIGFLGLSLYIFIKKKPGQIKPLLRHATDLIKYMNRGKCDIGTLASSFSSSAELNDENNVKVAVKEKLTSDRSFSVATDFSRKLLKSHEHIYHHVGIYAFTNKALVRYVGLERSKLELERKLEQLRALENNMSIHVGYINSSPLSVDTKNDLIEIKRIMKQ